ncbi:MAG: choice-of-anchor Q domain-containing protein, partial [Anaerolineae bacterium]
MIFFGQHTSRRRRIVFVLAAGGLLALLTSPASQEQTSPASQGYAITLSSLPARAAGPWYVAPGGDDGNDCLFPTTACATINGAIAKASSGDTIYIASGTYTDTSSAVVLLDKDVILSGGWKWDGTLGMQSGTSVIDGEGSRRGIVASSGVSATVELFVIQNGSSSDKGGGILNNGFLTLNSSVISHNTADDGGGGIFNAGGTVTLNNSTVNDNTAGNSGGGIGGNSTLTLNNSTVSGNAAVAGGGVYVWHTSPVTVTLNSSTVSNNTASQGGGVHSGDSSPTVTVILRNSILAGNMSDSNNSPDCSGVITSWGYNLVGNTAGCNLIRGIGDLTNVGANLGPLAKFPGYHPLLSESQAINAGNPDGCLGSDGLLTSDQRGFARFGRCDIGAYEAQSSKTATVPTILPGHQLTFTIVAQNGDVDAGSFQITDTLPISLAYVDNSLTATSGSYGHKNGVITWTGLVTAATVVSITFGATVSQTTPMSTFIVNSA